MTITQSTYAQTLRRISNAIDALQPYWHDKSDAPTALSDELADAIMAAPPEHLPTAMKGTPSRGNRRTAHHRHRPTTGRRLMRRLIGRARAQVPSAT